MSRIDALRIAAPGPSEDIAVLRQRLEKMQRALELYRLVYCLTFDRADQHPSPTDELRVMEAAEEALR